MEAGEARKARAVIKQKMMPFQRQGVEFAVKTGGKCLIGDEMGTGKTLQAICVALQWPEDLPALVVCPASLRYNWASEVEKWIPGLAPGEVRVAKGRSDVEAVSRKRCAFVIATYSLFCSGSKVAEACGKRGFGCVIVDESHYLRSRDSQRTKLLTPIMSSAKRLILLSGTPALARPVELYPQISNLASFGTYQEFTKRYCDAHRGRFGWDVSGCSNADELHGKLSAIMIRRLKKDVLSELPAKRRQLVEIEATDQALAEMSALGDASQAVEALVDGDKSSWQARGEKNAALMAAWQASGKAKIAAASHFVADTLNSFDGKVLVFAHHKAVMDGLDAEIARAVNVAGKTKKNTLETVRIDGSTSPAERHRLVDAFQRRPNVRLALLSVTAAGEGLTLTAASAVIFAELHWTPGALIQAEDRAHRIGQADSVNVYYLVCTDETKSLDAGLWRAIAKKVQTVGHTLDGAKTASLDAAQVDGRSADGRPDGPRPSRIGGEGDFADFVTTDVQAALAKAVPKGDIRSFFAAAKAKPGFSNKKKRPTEDVVESRRPVFSDRKNKKVRSSTGSVVIDLSQDDDDPVLDYSSHRSSTSSARRKSFPLPEDEVVDLALDDDDEVVDLALDGDDGDGDDEPVDLALGDGDDEVEPVPATRRRESALLSKGFYRVSRNTGRIQVLSDETGARVVAALDPKDLVDDQGRIVHVPEQLAQTDFKAFLAAWRGLRAVERDRLAAGAGVLSLPLRVVAQDLSGDACFDRGRARPEDRGDADAVATVSSSCAWCETPIPADDLRAAATLVFCNFDCACEWKLRKPNNSSDVRRQLFALEHGKCQLCNLDAHALYLRIKRLEPCERFQALLATPGFAPAGKKLAKHDKRLANPVEGDFWQADHILPVVEGGGCCSLDNFRTLCTPCHKVETSRLRDRLQATKRAIAAKGTRDLRTFFQPSSSSSAAS